MKMFNPLGIKRRCNALFVGERNRGKTFAQMALLKLNAHRFPHRGFVDASPPTEYNWLTFAAQMQEPITRALNENLAKYFIDELQLMIMDYAVPEWTIERDSLPQKRNYVVLEAGLSDKQSIAIDCARLRSYLCFFEERSLHTIRSKVLRLMDYIFIWPGSVCRSEVRYLRQHVNVADFENELHECENRECIVVSVRSGKIRKWNANL